MATRKLIRQEDKNLKYIKELRKSLKTMLQVIAQERIEYQLKREEDEKRRQQEEKRRQEEEKRRQEEEKRREAERVEEKERQIEHDKKMERMGIRLGNITQNMGLSTEEYFHNSLAETMTLGGVLFDDIRKNIHSKTKRLEGEFDVVLYNGDTIGLVECKYTAHENDIHKLTDKKVNDFKALFPEYSNYKFLLGIASFSFNEVVEALAKSKGVAVIKQVGDVIIIDDMDLKIY